MNESWQDHFDAHPTQSSGVPSEARLMDVHAAVLLPTFRVHHKDAGRQATVLMGAPASGKGTLRKSLESSDTVVVNPDECKRALPEYITARNSQEAAARVHEESSWLAKQVRAVAVARGCDVLVDSLGANLPRMKALMHTLKQADYRVRLICVHVLSIDELLRRVAYRGRTTGRYVPESVVKEAHDVVPKNFVALAVGATHAQLFDGLTQSLVLEWINGKRELHDRGFLASLGLQT